MQTKTVEGFFGKPKQITRDDFIKRWTEHVGQMYCLAATTAEYKELRDMLNRVAELAGQAWDRMPS